MHSEHCTHGPNCSRKPKFWKVYMVVGTNRAWIGTTGATTAAEAVRYFAKRRPGVRLVAERDIWTTDK